MGKPSSEKRREATVRYLAKIRRDPVKYKEYCDKAAARMRKRRGELAELLKTDSELLREKREKARLRQKKLRDKKREECAPYRNKKALAEAIKNIENALPEGFAKKVQIIEALHKKYIERENDSDFYN